MAVDALYLEIALHVGLVIEFDRGRIGVPVSQGREFGVTVREAFNACRNTRFPRFGPQV